MDKHTLEAYRKRCEMIAKADRKAIDFVMSKLCDMKRGYPPREHMIDYLAGLYHCHLLDMDDEQLQMEYDDKL